MNATNANNPKNLAAQWGLNRSDKTVTVAVIGSEQDIAMARDAFTRTPQPTAAYNLMNVKVLSSQSEVKPNKWVETAKFVGKAALGVGLGLAAGAAGLTVAAGIAGAGAGIGLVGGVLAGAGALAVGCTQKNGLLAGAGALLLTGALSTTGAPLADAAVALTALTAAIGTSRAAASFVGEKLGGHEALTAMRDAWRS